MLLKKVAVGFGLIWCFYSVFAHFGWILPGPQASPRLVLEFLQYNHSATAVMSFWGVVTTLLFLIFGNTLISIVSPQNCFPILQRVAQGGLLTYVVLTMASQSVMLSVSYFFLASSSHVLTLTGYQMAWAIDPSLVLFLTMATFVGASSWLAIRTSTVPPWLSVSGLVMAGLLVLSTGFVLVGMLSVLVPIMQGMVPLWFAIVIIRLMAEREPVEPLLDRDPLQDPNAMEH